MASALQQQLRSIAVAAGLQGNDTRDQRSSQKQGASQYIRFPSILYTEAVASDIHIDELYNQALAAYSQLVRLDPRFAQTRKALFSPPSAALRIHAADAEQRAALDGRVDVFCRLLQPYFITEYAQHALEYLIRMFHVHEHNVESLMKCGLAHHVCVEFSRLVRICRVEGTVFEFLGGVGKKGGGDTLPRVSREVLVSRMGVDRALWRFVCDMAKEASVGEWKVVGGGNGGGGVLMGWYAAVTCEVIGGMAAVDEEVVGFLLPYVVAGLRGGVVGGYRDATCMVVGGLSGSVVMRRELVDAIVRDIASSATPSSLPQTLLILSYLATSQRDNLTALAPQAFGHLSRLPNLASEVSKLTKRKSKAARFGYLLLCAAVEQAMLDAGGEGASVGSYDVLVKATAIGEYGSTMAAVFLEKATKPLQGAKKARLVEMMKLFDVYHGEAMDRAVNEYLASESGRSDSSAGRKHVLNVLEASLEDTVRAPLFDANVTLSAGIDHAQASIRIMALERLNEICLQSDSKLKEEAQITLKGALSRRLEDDDMGVVLTVLNLSTLPDLLPEVVLTDALVQSVDRCITAVYNKSSGKKTRGLGRKAAKAALRWLGSLGGTGDAPAVTVTAALLSAVFAGQASYTVSVVALKILAEAVSPLAKPLKDCVLKYATPLAKKAGSTGAGKGTPKGGAKRSRDGSANGGIDEASGMHHNFDLSGYNRDVITTLAKAALVDDDAYRLLWSVLTCELPLCSHQSKATVLCIFEQSVMMSSSDKKRASRREVIAGDVVEWFYESRDQPGMAARKSHRGLRALWDPKAKCISNQTLLDMAARTCTWLSIEPEAVFMCLDAVSQRAFDPVASKTGKVGKAAKTSKTSNLPQVTDLYVYLAQLEKEVYSQHLDVLLKKVQGPLDMLAGVWTGPAAGGEHIAALVAALGQWSACASSSDQKLTETDKQQIAGSMVALVCSMTHMSRDVRRAALEAAGILLESISLWWPANKMPKWTTRTIIESLLEVCTKHSARILGDADGVEYLLQQVAEATSVHGKQRKRGKSPRASESRPHLAFVDAEGLCSYLMQELRDGSTGSPATIPVLVRTLEFSSEAAKLCGIASDTLDKMFYDIEAEAFRTSLDLAEKAAAAELVNVLNDPMLYQSATSKTSKTVLKSSLCAAEWAGHPDLREVALKSLGQSARGHPSDDDLRAICRVLMAAASSESSSDCRNAAIETLDQMNIKPEVIIPFLRLSDGDASSSKRRRKDGTASMPPDEAAAGISLCLHTLELMQWKRSVSDMHLFVLPLQDLVQRFLALSLSVDAGPAANEDAEDPTPSGAQGPAVAGYGLQLCLNVLLSISEDASLEPKTRKLFDTKAIVACASSAGDHAVSTAALDLLRSRIESNPDGAMDHILQTVQTICAVVSSEADKYSTGLAAKAMSTAAAAWIGRGNSIHELVSNVIDAIIDTSSSRKYAILGAIVDSMPSNAAETMASIAYHLLLSSSSRSDGDGEGDGGESWQRDAAFNMLSKRKKALCLSALGGLLQLCIGCSKASKFSILHQANKITKKVLVTHSDAFRRLQEQSSDQSSELVESYEVIMQSILKELQDVGRARAKNSDPMLLELENGAYAVLDSLVDTMNPVQFINSLVRSLSYKEMTDAMRRKSLQLISHVVATELSATNAKDPAFHQCVHDAVGALVQIIQGTGAQTDICRQIALETLSGFIQRFATYYKDVFLQAIPPIVDLAHEAELPGVRGMALICIASFVGSMKDAVIPMTPRMIQAVVDSMRVSSNAAADDEASEAENAAALGALNALAEHLAAFLAPNLPDILSILLREDFCGPSRVQKAVGEATKTGHSSSVSGGSTYDVQALSNACRSTIASSVPARLLIGPSSSMLDRVLEEATGNPEDGRHRHSALHLMDMLAAVISNMDSTAVATYGGNIFSMVLKSLDTRRLYSDKDNDGNGGAPPIQAWGRLLAIESATVNCMLQLVLKLNETKFKPIFHRLLEWATRAPPGADGPSLARKIAFFNVINVLTENLKSVFTTYFSALLEPLQDALLCEADPDLDDAPNVGTVQLIAMRALTRCFMYDTSEFLNESTFDKLLEPLINLITAPRQLPRRPSHMTSKAARGSKKKQAPKPSTSDDETPLFVAIDPTDTLIENTVSASCPAWMQTELSTLSKTLVACLSQMAMASGMNNGESRWRPLHHAVLMATRSNDPISRCTALETVMAICATLQEEYLVLVPEALPFLSELLEDEDARVERRAVEVINAMSEKSGEDLQQYLNN